MAQPGSTSAAAAPAAAPAAANVTAAATSTARKLDFDGLAAQYNVGSEIALPPHPAAYILAALLTPRFSVGGTAGVSGRNCCHHRPCCWQRGPHGFSKTFGHPQGAIHSQLQ